MRQRPMRYLVAVFCAFAVGAAGSCHVPPAAETRSYYMARNSASDAAALGCYNGDKSGRMTLFFGAPTAVAGSYGATAWGAPDLRLADIENVVKNVIRGYAYCRTNGGYRLQIGVGTSNSTINSRRLLRAAVREESGGAGRFRGGNGIVREYEALADGISVSLRGERFLRVPPGLLGGGSPAAARATIVRAGGEEVPLSARSAFELNKGDRLLVESCGGAGYGPPNA